MAENEEKVTSENAEETKVEETAEEAKAEEAKAEEAKVEEKAEEVKTEPKKKGLSKGALIGIIAGGVVVVLAIAVFVTSFIFSSAAVNAYNAASASKKLDKNAIANYTEAYDKINFPLAGLTSNSATVGQIKYDYVVKVLAKKGNYFEGAKILETLKGKVSDEKLDAAWKIEGFDLCKVGNVATLGSWEQDGDNLNGEEALEWIVLDIKETKSGTRALIMTKDVIGAVEKWTKNEKSPLYSASEINAWCESDFYLSLIQGSDVVKNNVPKIKVATETVEGCTDCTDTAEAHAFVLSFQEASKYFAEGSDLAKYISMDELQISAKAKYEGATTNGFWLRNAGESDGFICGVLKGEINKGVPSYSSLGIRPCMWVTIGK